MLTALTEFVEELRHVGIPVSMVEAIDAAAALRHLDLSDREGLRVSLAATMVKNDRHRAAFDTAFDVFFGLSPARPAAAPGDDFDTAGGEPGGALGGAAGGGAGGSDDEVEALFAALVEALSSGDAEALRRLVREAVDRLSGIEPGRPVGGRYYLYRVLRRLDPDRMAEALLGRIGGRDGEGLDARLAAEQVQALVEELRAELRHEIIRRLVEDRGAAAVAKTLRRPLVEDLDLMHASRDELDEIERVIEPLSRRLASRLAQRRRRGRKGRLDVRRTIRKSLAHGGVLIDPTFKAPRVSKPELVLLCDVSGSMATFARFTMQLVYAIGNQFSKVRSFAFIDGLDEVTGFFGPGVEFHEALVRMGREAELVWRDGHSDYGHAFEQFWFAYGDAVTSKTTVIITGDARNNYRDTGAPLLGAIANRARAVFWLNPEAMRYWNTGDSVMNAYAHLTDGVHQVRTLRHLEQFVEDVALPTYRPRITHASEFVADEGWITAP